MKETPCHPIHSTLTPGQLARDLAVRNLTDPTEGGHAIQRLIDAAVTMPSPQPGTARCDGTAGRGSSRSRTTTTGSSSRRTRSAATCAYTRYVDQDRMLRSRSGHDRRPARLAADPSTTPARLPGRGVPTRRHRPTACADAAPAGPVAHRPPTPEPGLEQMADLLVEALIPAALAQSRHHPYTLDGRQLDVRWDSEVGRGGPGAAPRPPRRARTGRTGPGGAASPWAWAWTGC